MGLKVEKLKHDGAVQGVKTHKIKKLTLKDLWADENNKKLSALKLSKVAGVKLSTAKAFLKKNDDDMKLTVSNTNKKVFCPAGSQLPGQSMLT